MSISAKLADYDGTRELLGRLNVRELKKLARQNNITLEKENQSGKARRPRTKTEAIDILVASEFKESDLIELLGISRLTKDEILNQMRTMQLKSLAKETGVVLEKSTLLGTKKAAKREDIIDVLQVLSTPKVREFAQKIPLAGKPTKKMEPRRKEAKPAIGEPVKKKAKPRRARKPRIRAEKPVVPLVEKPTEVVSKVAELIEAPTVQAAESGTRILEEAFRERIIEREIIRREKLPFIGKKGPERTEVAGSAIVGATVKKAKKR